MARRCGSLFVLLGVATAACGGADATQSQPGLAPSAEPPPAPPPAPDASVTTTTDAGPSNVVCDPRSFGAKADGKTKDTAAIQSAIDACATTGGTVRLEGGKFLSGMLRLKSAVTLYIDATATLLGSQDDADYPDLSPATNNTQLRNCRKAFLYAEGAHDVRIAGKGTIDGNGNVAKWLGPSKDNPEYTRPMAVFTALSKNVTIEDVTIKNSAMWTLVNMETDDLTIRNVTIESTGSGNRDGIDVVDCHHVLVEGCTITSEDDSICFKSGVARGVEDVTVRNCKIKRSIVANGLKFGTASFGAFKNVIFDGIDVQNVDKAAMAVESVDGADIANVVFRNITFRDVGTPLFLLVGDRGTRPNGEARRVGGIDGVRFEHVRGDNGKHAWGSIVSGVALQGTTYRIKNVAFDDVHVTVRGGVTNVPADPPEYAGQYPDPNLWGNVPASALFVRHAEGVTFTNSAFSAATRDARPLFVVRDGINVATP